MVDTFTSVSRSIGNFVVVANLDAATAVDRDLFVAPYPLAVVSANFIWNHVGGSSNTVALRRITDTSASGAAAGATVIELLTGTTVDLTAVANTLVTPAIIQTAGANLMAKGDRLGLDFSGTTTGLVGLIIVVEVRPRNAKYRG